MNRSIAISSAYCLLLTLVAAPLRAQSGASGGILGQSAPAHVEAGSARTIIIPQRDLIVVERVHARRGWWKHSKYHVVTVYYDGARFYRRPFDRRVLRRVVVYEWGGRYYVDQDERRWERGRHHDHDGDRHDRDD
jgi:hypothetical protein